MLYIGSNVRIHIGWTEFSPIPVILEISGVPRRPLDLMAMKEVVLSPIVLVYYVFPWQQDWNKYNKNQIGMFWYKIQHMPKLDSNQQSTSATKSRSEFSRQSYELAYMCPMKVSSYSIRTFSEYNRAYRQTIAMKILCFWRACFALHYAVYRLCLILPKCAGKKRDLNSL